MITLLVLSEITDELPMVKVMKTQRLARYLVISVVLRIGTARPPTRASASACLSEWSNQGQLPVKRVIQEQSSKEVYANRGDDGYTLHVDAGGFPAIARQFIQAWSV